LLSVYAAIEAARHIDLPQPRRLYPVLLALLAVAWAVPQDSLLSLSPVPRFVAAVALAFAPIFVANLVFAQRFRQVGSATTAFAANLLGAIVGGMVEYLALVTGYRFLLVVVGVLYALAFLTTPRMAATARACPAEHVHRLASRQVEGSVAASILGQCQGQLDRCFIATGVVPNGRRSITE
jgi:hypothetical protein